MESKRKHRKVRKAVPTTPVPQKSPKQDKPTSQEALTIYNGNVVSELLSSQPWTELAFPLILEMIASVSGRYTNGRFHKGKFTKDGDSTGWLAGYQCALEEFNNHLHDFIVAKNNLVKSKKHEEEEKNAEIYNPFLEGDTNAT